MTEIPIKCRLWFRTSTSEWVLEFEHSSDEVYAIQRFTAPGRLRSDEAIERIMLRTDYPLGAVVALCSTAFFTAAAVTTLLFHMM